MCCMICIDVVKGKLKPKELALILSEVNPDDHSVEIIETIAESDPQFIEELLDEVRELKAKQDA